MQKAKNIYKIFRSILFSLILVSAGLYLFLYILFSIPAFQNCVRDVAASQLSKYLKSEVKIGRLDIYPFNQVVLSDIRIKDQSGNQCISLSKLGTGVNLGRLIFKKKIVFTYAEIIGLDVHITKKSPESPVNIQFIFDAFKPKDKKKPPTKFELQIHSIVLRESSLKFDKLWIGRGQKGKFDPSHISLKDIKADISLPLLKNDDFKIYLRQLSLKEESGFKLEKISFGAHVTNHFIDIEKLDILLPGTHLMPGNIKIQFDGYADIPDALKRNEYSLRLADNKVTLSDFKSFLPLLSSFDFPLYLTLDAVGDRTGVTISDFELSAKNDLSLRIIADANDLTNPERLSARVDMLKLNLSDRLIEKIISGINGMEGKFKDMIGRVGSVSIDAKGNYSKYDIGFLGFVKTAAGDMDADIKLNLKGKRNLSVSGKLLSQGIDLHRLTRNESLGEAAFHIQGDLNLVNSDFNGMIKADIDHFDYNGHRFNGILADASKSGEDVKALISIHDPLISTDLSIDGAFRQNNFVRLLADVNVSRFEPAGIGLMRNYPGYVFSGKLNTDLHGSGFPEMDGFINLNSLKVTAPGKKNLILSNLNISNFSTAEGKYLILQSDWINGEVKGLFRLDRIHESLLSVLAESVPVLKPLLPKNHITDRKQNFDFNFTVENNNEWTEFFNLPFRILVPVPIRGEINDMTANAEINVSVPYLQQGKDKLIRDTRLHIKMDGNNPAGQLSFSSLLPGKNGDIKIGLDAMSMGNNLLTDISWKYNRKERFDGRIELAAMLGEYIKGKQAGIDVNVKPTTFYVADVPWNVGESQIGYENKKLSIKDLRVWHENQYVDIDGVASEADTDTLNISFSDFNLDYLFETLNINYVTFGGNATGQVKATSCFSRHPVAFTESLEVENLSYNSALLGDHALLRSKWNNREQEVEIGAEIFEKGRHVATVDGGVFVTRDSLGFDITTDKVSIGFLRPFIQAFASEINGRATGHVNLYGTFSDIDLVGKVYADTISMKVDYTNVTYSGKDTVYMTPGRITIPEFRLTDRHGGSGIMSGVVTHRYFHDPRFEFKLTNARKLLAYDTNASINPDWYGTVFVNGNASVKGVPGLVNIFIDVSTAPGSTFTYVLSDREAAEDYTFLSFTDRRKEKLLLVEKDTVPQFVKDFHKKVDDQENSMSQFGIDIRASITPAAKVNIIMDPRAGDKITGTGEGSLQISYNSDMDNMSMYGKYTIEEGKYNFTLQDLIIKDFTIKQGSSISFNGNPLMANLDISAIYKVNTNLSDLDKSFSQDRDLNRTNVPVDAILNVKGELQNPEISFDIGLPTLTQDVERKVRSIISTDDMLNRQIIYLLALNRFYTPEYMSGQAQSGGGELASVASSTISSQLSSMLGHLSDKWTLAPSFRSDKGDFSDTEFDVALSSRLLNNRLLINGNFGYRDRNNSQTTFVGDFDIEYLLSRSGNLRLKAYNHFNDQNYYLKSALTTQGLGIVYRRDFDNPFTFLRRKKKGEKKNVVKIEKIKSKSKEKQSE